MSANLCFDRDFGLVNPNELKRRDSVQAVKLPVTLDKSMARRMIWNLVVNFHKKQIHHIRVGKVAALHPAQCKVVVTSKFNVSSA